jgi:hypothetical protein
MPKTIGTNSTGPAISRENTDRWRSWGDTSARLYSLLDAVDRGLGFGRVSASGPIWGLGP